MERLTRVINGSEYVAVVYSPDFGAGWSTWGAPIADDGRIAQWLMDHYHYYIPTDEDAIEDGNIIRCSRDEGEVGSEEIEKLKKFCVEECGYSSKSYFGGARDLDIAWIKRGTRYHIKEYDGQETVQEISDISWSTA